MTGPLRLLCLGAAAREAASAVYRAGGEPPTVRGATPEDLVRGGDWGIAAGDLDAVLFGIEGDERAWRSCLRLLRARLPAIPVIVAVPATLREVGREAVRLGAEDYVVVGETEAEALHRVLQYARAGKDLEASLLHNPDLFHHIWGALTELVAIVGKDGRLLYSSPSHRRLLGDPAALLGTDAFGEVHPADEDRLREVVTECLATGCGRSATLRLVLPDGSIRHLEAEGTVIPGADGVADKVVLVGHDVTHQRQIEASLREREEFFRHISENMSDLVAVVDRHGRRLYNSQSYQLLFGGHTPQPASDSFAEIHPEDRERIRQVFTETLATGCGQRAEFRFVLPDGSIRYLESVGSVIRDEAGEVSKILVVSRDTTERRATEEALARERNLLRTLVDRLPDFIYVKDRQGRFVLNNTAHARLLGYDDPATLVGRRDADVFPPDLAARYADDDAAVADQGVPVLNREEPVRDRDGRQLWVLTSKVPLRDASGEVVGLVGMSRDITDRRSAEDALRESRERLELVIQGSRDGIWDWNLQTNEVYFSARWKGMLGYLEDEVKDTFEGWQQLIHPDDRERAMRTLREYFDGLAPVYELEHRLRHKDGSYRWILARGVVLRDGSGRGLRMVGSHVDLTERKKTEDRLRRAARWESVTTLAAAVAHEVKNPLQTILLGVEFLANRPLAEDPDVAGLLASMRNAAQQADTIIRSLRDYAVQRQPQFRVFDLNELIEATLAAMSFDLDRQGVDVTLELAPSLPAVLLDVEQVKQVCWTVFRNGLEAMAASAGPRRLVIRTAARAERPETHRPVPSQTTAQGWVVVEVDDTGPGVAADVLPRVFDLFFTTKQSGKGTGIGLSLAGRILEAHGGVIDLANRPEGGTRVTIVFPVRPRTLLDPEFTKEAGAAP